MKELDVAIPIYGMGSRSLKNWMASLITGNRFEEPAKRMVNVLEHINVTLHKGDRIGLLGPNGAGKSSFLRVISGIYAPTSGELIINGTTTSILSVGAGMDLDSSGRENLLLLGLTLGHTKQQMIKAEKMLIEFIDIGESIDRPVRTYSAGMQLRLAFAVSTLDTSDILLIDEVIGTGDIQFQNKAISRSTELMEKSKLLVVASHDTNFLSNNCNRGLVFFDGKIDFDGSIEDAILFYHNRLAC